jgi:branched-chain amino acid transport system substrate-binding protein
MTSIQDGEELALDQAHRNLRDLNVNVVQLDDGDAGGWNPTAAENVASNATKDRDTIAYIGDYDSGATATTLPITNRADILQVSPASSYVGLTDPNPVDQIGEPGRYYPSGVRTFARLVPSDVKEAVATTSFMRSLGVPRLYVLADDSAPYDGPFDSAIAPIVASDATKAGITLAGSAQIDTASTIQPAGYAGVAAAQPPARPPCSSLRRPVPAPSRCGRNSSGRCPASRSSRRARSGSDRSSTSSAPRPPTLT